MRLIDADALREKAQWMEMPDNQGINFDVRAVSVSSIDLAPTLDVEPVRHGRWIWSAENGWTCSNCKFDCWHYSERFDPYAPLPDAEYCPKCGAKMDLPNQ